MTVAIYLRLSSADEKKTTKFEYESEIIRDSNSIKNQRDLLIDFLKNHDDLCKAEVIEICDDGFSGTNFERPGMKQLLEFVKNGSVNCIIVKDFSRFGRNYIEAGDYIEQVFPLLGVRFISVNDGYDSFTQDTSAGNLNVAFLNLIHDLYSKDISEKVKTAQRQKWIKGENIAAYTIFGYTKLPNDKHKIIIDDNAADIVRQIFNMAVAGNNTTDIAKQLNKNNIPTANVYKCNSDFSRDWKKQNIVGAFWTVSMVYKILTDERYTGKAIYGKRSTTIIDNRKSIAIPKTEWIIYDNAFEAIISKDTFEIAQKILRKRNVISKSIMKPRNKIRCGGCGRRMQKYECKNPVFVCKTPQYINSPECVQEQILESKIENVLFEIVRRQIKIFAENNTYKKSECINKSAQTQELKKSLRQFEQERIFLYDNYKDNKITREDYLIKREKFNIEINSLENQLTLLEQEFNQIEFVKIKQNEQQYMQFEEFTELPQEIVDFLIDSIIIYNTNRIEIKFKVEDAINEIFYL